MAADSQHPGVVGKCLSWIDLLAGTRADFVIASGRWALSYLMGDNTSFLHFEATEFWFGWRFFFLLFNEQIPNGCMGEHSGQFYLAFGD